MSETETSSSKPEAFVLQVDLSPADAAEAKESLLAAFEAASSSKTPMMVETEGETSTPCALQLLVSAKRSAESANVELVLSEQAQTLLANVHAD